MRFVTFLGLTVIAKCINPVVVAGFAPVIMFTLVLSSILDGAEFFKIMFINNNNTKS